MERKVILYIAISLDGYIARENGDVDWLGGDGSEPNADNGYIQFYENIDTVIMGNNTYKQIMGWGEYPYKGKESYVYTNKSIENNEDVTFTNRSPKELIKELKSKAGKNIWIVGGTGIIKEFMKVDLIDEYIIAVIPILIRKGIPLFLPTDNFDIKLKLKESKIFDGIVQNHYLKI